MNPPACALHTIYVNRKVQEQLFGDITRHAEVMDIRCTVLSKPVEDPPVGIFEVNIERVMGRRFSEYEVSVPLTPEEMALLDKLTTMIEERVEQAFFQVQPK